LRLGISAWTVVQRQRSLLPRSCAPESAPSSGAKVNPVKSWLSEIVVPALLITGYADPDGRTRDARWKMSCVIGVAVVRAPCPALEGAQGVQRVSRLAIDWFTQHLSEAAPVHGTHRVALI